MKYEIICSTQNLTNKSVNQEHLIKKVEMQKNIQRPIPQDRVGYKNWIWVSPLRITKQNDQYTQFERDAKLIIDKKEAKTGAWHRDADGDIFTRIYVVGTNLSKGYNPPNFNQSLGQWNPSKSSSFSFKDVRIEPLDEDPPMYRAFLDPMTGLTLVYEDGKRVLPTPKYIHGTAIIMYSKIYQIQGKPEGTYQMGPEKTAFQFENHTWDVETQENANGIRTIEIGLPGTGKGYSRGCCSGAACKK